MKQRYDSIDLVKAIAALFIIGIHVDPLSNYSWHINQYLFQVISHFGVPFFLMASSFFLGKKLKDSKEMDLSIRIEILKKFVYRLLILFFVWFILYIPQIYNSFLRQPNQNAFEEIKNILIAIVCGNVYRGSWFISATILGAVLVYGFLYRFKTVTIIILVSPLFLFRIIDNAYVLSFAGTNFGQFWHYLEIVFNYLVTIGYGSFFFALGKLFVDREKQTERANIWLVMTGVSISLIFMVIESEITEFKLHWGYTSDPIFSLIPASLFIFALTLRLKNIKISGSFFLRKFSTFAYLIQFSLISGNYMFQSYQHITVNKLVEYVIIIVCALIGTYLIIHLSKYKKLRFLRYLY